MRKVRFKTWYWGNYCIAEKNDILPPGFEEYSEELHGWHNSEEFKLRGKPQYKSADEREDTLKSVLGTSYIKRMLNGKNTDSNNW